MKLSLAQVLLLSGAAAKGYFDLSTDVTEFQEATEAEAMQMSDDSDSDDDDDGDSGENDDDEEGHHGPKRWSKLSKEQRQAFKDIYEYETSRYDDLPKGSKLRKMMKKWKHHEMKHEDKKMFKEMFKNGGIFDHFAGDDGAMSFEEAKTFNGAMRDGLSKEFGENIPDYKDGMFKKIFDAYSGLSDGEGFTKADAKRADHIMKRLRDTHDVDEETMKAFRPLFRMEARKYENMPRGAPMKKFWNKYMKNGARGDVKKMNEFMMSKGGVFDQFAGDDGALNFDEARKMSKSIHKQFAEKMGGDNPEYSDEQFKQIYEAYDNLSEGEGFTKKDSRKGQRIMNAIRKQYKHWKPSRKNRRAFGEMLDNEIERVEEHFGEDSKMYKFMQQWLNGNGNKEMAAMDDAMYADGGAFDKFAGDDGSMSLDEARKMNAAFRAEAGKKFGVEIPGYSEEDFKAMYDAYDNLDPKKEGITKGGAKRSQRIMNWVRDHRITDMEYDAFYPVAEWVYDGYDELDDGNKQKEYFMNQIGEKPDKKMMKWWMGKFDEYDKNGDGKLNWREYKKLEKEGERQGAEMFGEGVDWDEGDIRFFYIMMDAISDFKWNKWGKQHDNGVTKRDLRRGTRILNDLYEDIDESDSDDEDEGADDAGAEGAATDDHELLFI